VMPVLAEARRQATASPTPSICTSWNFASNFRKYLIKKIQAGIPVIAWPYGNILEAQV